MSLPPIEQQLFRRVCGRYATGITIVTVLDANGAPQGMTANSFTSVSLDPPLVLICIDKRTSFLAHFEPEKPFAINILRETQQELSSCFARSGRDRFEGIEWVPGTNGAPILFGVLATLECRVTQTIEAGDHIVVIGLVAHATWEEGQPLLYFNGSYQSLRTET